MDTSSLSSSNEKNNTIESTDHTNENAQPNGSTSATTDLPAEAASLPSQVAATATSPGTVVALNVIESLETNSMSSRSTDAMTNSIGREKVDSLVPPSQDTRSASCENPAPIGNIQAPPRKRKAKTLHRPPTSSKRRPSAGVSRAARRSSVRPPQPVMILPLGLTNLDSYHCSSFDVQAANQFACRQASRDELYELLETVAHSIVEKCLQDALISGGDVSPADASFGKLVLMRKLAAGSHGMCTIRCSMKRNFVGCSWLAQLQLDDGFCQHVLVKLGSLSNLRNECEIFQQVWGAA